MSDNLNHHLLTPPVQVFSLVVPIDVDWVAQRIVKRYFKTFPANTVTLRKLLKYLFWSFRLFLHNQTGGISAHHAFAVATTREFEQPGSR